METKDIIVIGGVALLGYVIFSKMNNNSNSGTQIIIRGNDLNGKNQKLQNTGTKETINRNDNSKLTNTKLNIYTGNEQLILRTSKNKKEDIEENKSVVDTNQKELTAEDYGLVGASVFLSKPVNVIGTDIFKMSSDFWNAKTFTQLGGALAQGTKLIPILGLGAGSVLDYQELTEQNPSKDSLTTGVISVAGNIAGDLVGTGLSAAAVFGGVTAPLSIPANVGGQLGTQMAIYNAFGYDYKLW